MYIIQSTPYTVSQEEVQSTRIFCSSLFTHKANPPAQNCIAFAFLPAHAARTGLAVQCGRVQSGQRVTPQGDTIGFEGGILGLVGVWGF